MRGVVVGVSLACLLLASLSAAADTAPKSGTPVAALPENFEKRVVATGLANPHNMAFGPDGFLWVTEQITRRVVRVDPKSGTISVAVKIDDAIYSNKGAQDGLLGLALHPDLLKGKGADYVYVSMTYAAGAPEPFPNRTLIRRYAYDPKTETLGSPVDILKGLPSSHDHQAARLLFGPDGKLYYSIGDQGANQLAYLCVPNEAQVLRPKRKLRPATGATTKGRSFASTPTARSPSTIRSSAASGATFTPGASATRKAWSSAPAASCSASITGRTATIR